MGIKENMKFFINIDSNIFYASDDELKHIVDRISSLLNIIRCHGKLFLLNNKSKNPNDDYNKSILSSPESNRLQRDLISNINSNLTLNNKVVVLELFTKNRDVVYTALSNSQLKYREVNEIEELQLQINLESNFSIGVEELNMLIEDTQQKILSNKKTVKKANNIFKGFSEPIYEYAKSHILESYTPSVTEIKREGIRYNTHDERYYLISNLLYLKNEIYPLKFVLDLEVDMCISFELKSKHEVVSSVKKTIDIEKQNLQLQKKVSEVDLNTLKQNGRDLTDSGTHYNTTLNALYKITIIIKSRNIDDNDSITSTLIGNNIEVYNLDGIHEEAAEIFNFDKTLNLRTLPTFFASSSQLADLFVIPPNPIEEKGGVFLGYNKANKPIYINFLEYFNGRTSFNFMIDGTMGQGKSNTVKRILSQLYCNPSFKYLYILDPDSEYIDLVNQLGGKVKKYDKKNATNFLHLRVYKNAAELISEDENEKEKLKAEGNTNYKAVELSFESDDEAAIHEKVQFLNKVFEILIDKEGESPGYNVDLVVTLFNRIYKHYFSSTDSKEYTLSFSESIKYAEDNKIYDQYIEIDGDDGRVNKLKEIIARLRTFFEGNGELLDTRSPDIEDDIICYDLKSVIGTNSVSAKVRKIILLSTASQIFYKTSEARETGHMGMFITEEFNKLVNKHETYLEEFYETFSTRIRKFNFGMGIILHSIHDVKHLSNIFKNILIKIMLYTGDSLEDYKEAYRLSDKEYDIISAPKRGNAYIIAGNARTDAQMAINTEFENQLFGAAGGR